LRRVPHDPIQWISSGNPARPDKEGQTLGTKQQPSVSEADLRRVLLSLPYAGNVQHGDEWFVGTVRDTAKTGDLVRVHVAKTRSVRFARLIARVMDGKTAVTITRGGVAYDVWKTEEWALTVG